MLVACYGSTNAQQFALDMLEGSPRHHEWVQVKTESGRTVHSFVTYPQNSKNSPAVIVIHENRGLTDWVRSVTDQLAAAGYIAIAPDLLSGFDADHEKTSDFASSDDARTALYQLDPDQVTGDLKSVQRYAANLDAANGTVAVMGFCWGGSQTFRFATNTDGLAAAMVFYGTAPDDTQDIRRIEVPVYGFYGENDQRVNASIPETEKMMEQFDKVYKYEIYPGAGHAFMRNGDDPEGTEANKNARDASWERLKRILAGL